MKNEARGTIVPQVKEILATEIRASDCCLELACGTGQYQSVIPGKYIGLDITAKEYKPGFPRRVDLVADAQALPFKPGAFDRVFIVAALLTIPDVARVAKETHRVLKEGGKFLVFDYNYHTTKRLHRMDKAHLHIWTPWHLSRILKRAGFHAEMIGLDGQESEWSWKKIFSWASSSREIFWSQFREGWNIVKGLKLTDARQSGNLPSKPLK